MMENDISVNGYPLSTWGAKSHLDYIIGETPVSSDIFQPLNQNTIFLMKNTIGLRTIEINITFEGRTLYEAKVSRSKFNLEVFNGCEIYIPDDGFHYSSLLVKCGAEELVGIGKNSAQIKSKYVFKGFRHGPLVKRDYPTPSNLTLDVFCESTIPKTCAKITVTFNGSGKLFIANNALNDIPSGVNTCVVDGTTKQITVNGQNWMSHTDFTKWPTLNPGMNYVTVAPSSGSTSTVTLVTVEFEPTYL